MLFPIKDYNPTKRTAYLTIALIVINVLVFAYQSYFSGKPFNYHILKSAMIPWEVTHQKNIAEPIGYQVVESRGYVNRKGVYRDIAPFKSVLFSLFMHGSLAHLLGNMLFLWIFGNNIEDHLGRVKFIIFYFAAGVGAALIHVIFNFNSLIPVIGASGAVSAVMGAYLILYPHAKVRTLVFIFIIVTFVDLPAGVFLVLWFIFQFFHAGSASGIAWIAHIGGFVIGILLIKLLADKRKPVIEIIE
ncbi:MAG: rhomboid family intramembrane serine protease [bacterium]|nr:rhomboid family intramembrane serine protease [bacterium]